MSGPEEFNTKGRINEFWPYKHWGSGGALPTDPDFNSVSVDGKQLTPSGVQYVDVQLSHAEILAGTIKQITPAPGPDYGILLLEVYYVIDTQAGAYAAQTCWIDSATSSGAASISPLDQALLTQGHLGGPTLSWPPRPSEPLRLYQSTQALTTGGDPANTVSARVWYSVVPVGPFGD